MLPLFRRTIWQEDLKNTLDLQNKRIEEEKKKLEKEAKDKAKKERKMTRMKCVRELSEGLKRRTGLKS